MTGWEKWKIEILISVPMNVELILNIYTQSC